MASKIIGLFKGKKKEAAPVVEATKKGPVITQLGGPGTANTLPGLAGLLARRPRPTPSTILSDKLGG